MIQGWSYKSVKPINAFLLKRSKIRYEHPTGNMRIFPLTEQSLEGSFSLTGPTRY